MIAMTICFNMSQECYEFLIIFRTQKFFAIVHMTFNLEIINQKTYAHAKRISE